MFDFDMNTINSAERYGEARKAFDEQERKNAKRDTAIYQTAEESKKQNVLLLEQVEELKKQRELLSEQVSDLKGQNQLLKQMYDDAKAETIENQKQAKQNKVFGWVSFAVGTVIGILGVIFGIIF